MTEQDPYELLVALEVERQAQEEKLNKAPAEIERLLKEREEADKALQRSRTDLTNARKEVERQERLRLSKEQADYVNSARAELSAKFEAMAEGHVWWDGILDHQKQGIFFGAVAKRWILGDVPGLGNLSAGSTSSKPSASS